MTMNTPTALHRLAAPVAAVALMSALASVAMAQPAPPAEGMAGMGGPGPRHVGMHRMGPGMGAMPGMAGAPGLLADHELDAIGASAEQKTKVREILRAAHDDLRKQQESGRDLHQQMQQLLSAPQVDAAAAEALRQKISTQRDAASKRMLQAALDAGAVLTPEQRQKLAERRKQRQDMMQRHQRERDALMPPPRS
jgi:Spy/CpxP family protein refolding chaperone